MKRLMQICLLLILFFGIFGFYQIYFKENKNSQVNLNQEVNQLQNNMNNLTENNIIKNLSYKINIDNNNNYEISSDLSKIVLENKIEIIFMEGVSAILTRIDNQKLLINSDKAIYYSDSYKTIFENNVKILYLNNEINAEKMELDFEDNSILILNNVKLQGPEINLLADKIFINLISKDIKISMNSKNKDILVSSSK